MIRGGRAVVEADASRYAQDGVLARTPPVGYGCAAPSTRRRYHGAGEHSEARLLSEIDYVNEALNIDA
jgi:hypothetical protein